MEIKKIKIENLIPADYNPRKISKKELEKLKNSIQEFGYIEPIIFNKRNNKVIGGHQRLLCLKQLDFKEIECVVVDLPENKEKALNVALNKISGEFDDAKLVELLQELAELDELCNTGFDEEEFNELLKSLDVTPEPEAKEDDFDSEEAAGNIKEPITKKGDIWKLGRHFVGCLDSTEIASFEKLLKGKQIDLVQSDPPYGVSIVRVNTAADGGSKAITIKKPTGTVGGGKIASVNEYDQIIGDDTTETAKNFYNTCLAVGAKNFILWGGNYFTDFLPPKVGWIIWDKREDIPSNNFADGEAAWTSFDKPLRIYRQLWSGLIRKGDRKVEGLKRCHPTQKPVEMTAKVLQDYSKENDIIFDGFLGSGTTLIAAEQTNRICYGMELSEKYCDVIIARYEKLTGQKAELVNA